GDSPSRQKNEGAQTVAQSWPRWQERSGERPIPHEHGRCQPPQPDRRTATRRAAGLGTQAPLPLITARLRALKRQIACSRMLSGFRSDPVFPLRIDDSAHRLFGSSQYLKNGRRGSVILYKAVRSGSKDVLKDEL